MDKLANMQDRLDQMGQPVQAEDILRWNENVHRTRDNTEDVDKIKKWMQLANFDMLKQEINSLNVFVLTLTPKLDFEKTQGEVRKINAQITDIEYNLQDLTAKINDVDQRGESFATFQRLENQKFTERLDKLEANVAQIRNIISKISEQLKAGFAQNDNQD